MDKPWCPIYPLGWDGQLGQGCAQPMVSSAPWDKGWALKAVNVGFVLSYWYDMSIVLQDSLKLGLSNAITISV